METTRPRAHIEVRYEAAAQEYLRNLPPEHFMEATAQATQRKITLESLDLVSALRPDVHVFNELLVQYERRGERKPGQVVPDNMVVIGTEPIRAMSSYNLPLEAEPPFWMLEYVSKNNRRKDYDENFDKYEKELRVPYYLVFYPDNQELTLYHLEERKYVSVKENSQGRHAIPELDLEMALLEGWVRYWYQGKLLPLPADLMHEADKYRLLAEENAQRAEENASVATAESQRADIEAKRASEFQRRFEETDKALRAAEKELAELRTRLQ
jgi:Uma2 family endonuclease